MNQFQIKTIVFKLLSFGFLCIGFLSNCSSKSNEKKPNIVKPSEQYYIMMLLVVKEMENENMSP